MIIKSTYQKRPIRFVELYNFNEWNIKIYSISIHQEFVSKENIELAKLQLGKWLTKSALYPLDTYKIATLIIHEGKEGCFAIINWWIDENMLQNFVYLKENNNEYKLFSENGMMTCIWELAIIWHERNAWLNHILLNHNNPNFDAYLQEQFNDDI